MELQALLRQGQEVLRDQLEKTKKAEERAEEVLVEYQQALVDIANISQDADYYFNKIFDTYKRYLRYLQTPGILHMKKPERLRYLDGKYEEYLGESIKHHEESIRILQDTLDHIQSEQQGEAYRWIVKASEIGSDKTDIPGHNEIDQRA